jgi:type III secretory pathway component EscV
MTNSNISDNENELKAKVSKELNTRFILSIITIICGILFGYPLVSILALFYAVFTIYSYSKKYPQFVTKRNNTNRTNHSDDYTRNNSIDNTYIDLDSNSTHHSDNSIGYHNSNDIINSPIYSDVDGNIFNR